MTRNLGHLFRIIPHISNFEVLQTFCVYSSTRNPGRVSLPEFPTSATVYVTFLSNDQIMPNVESVNDLGSFTIIPAGLSNERIWYLYEHIYGKSATRMRATSHARSRWHRQRNQKTLLVRMTMMTKCKEKGEVNM